MKHNVQICMMALVLVSGTALAAPQQPSFATPDKAVEALIGAVTSSDSTLALSILGDPDGDIVKSGDPVADKIDKEAFMRVFNEKHEIVKDENTGEATLRVGTGNWPFAVPMVHGKDGWRFDAEKGAEELYFRRIGRNELDALEVLRAYVDAQMDYSQLMHARTGHSVYAQRFLSSEGKTDGLYWPASTDAEPSPLGELVAKASDEGYSRGSKPVPYHGYYYKILTKQAASAEGGALDYVVDGKMIGGFALVAWPASYGNSGVVSFMVNHLGTLYERDLGSDTAAVAEKIAAFNPEGWKPVME